MGRLCIPDLLCELTAAGLAIRVLSAAPTSLHDVSRPLENLVERVNLGLMEVGPIELERPQAVLADAPIVLELA